MQTLALTPNVYHGATYKYSSIYLLSNYKWFRVEFHLNWPLKYGMLQSIQAEFYRSVHTTLKIYNRHIKCSIYRITQAKWCGVISRAFLKLSISGAPQFQSKFRVLTTRRGERTMLECSSFGNRPITFIWRRQGVIVEQDSEPR